MYFLLWDLYDFVRNHFCNIRIIHLALGQNTLKLELICLIPVSQRIDNVLKNYEVYLKIQIN